MKTPHVLTFHGSPGTPYDFEPLKRAIPQLRWNEFIRYTEAKPQMKRTKGSFTIAMGYSYGCTEALKEAATNDAFDAIILVAPYLFDTKASLLKRLVVGGLGKVLLKNKTSSIIEDFLKKSAAPAEVPAILKTYGEHLKNVDLLRASVWEKKGFGPDDIEIKNLLSQCAKKGLPLFILYGEGDETSKKSTHIDPLLNLYPQELCELHTINSAGHALLYTHYIDAAKAIGSFIKNKVEAISFTPELLSAQKSNKEQFNYENPETPFGYHEGEHQLNNVASFLYHHLNKNPDQDILTWVHPKRLEYWDKESQLPHDSISVKNLDLLVGKIAQGLRDMGLKKNDKVIIFIPMSLYLYSAMFAVQKIGAVAVFLDSWARRDQMGVAVDVVKPKAIISVEMAFDYLSEVKEIQEIPFKIVAGPHKKNYTETLENLFATEGYAPSEPVEKEHTALITFTTGSSGTPKGADRSHRFLAAQHYALNRHLPYETGDADLPAFPIFSLNNLAAGVKTVIPAFDVGSPKPEDAILLLKQFEETNTVATTLSPSLLRTLYNHCLKEGITLTNLKRIVTGGAPVSRDDIVASKKIAPNAEVLVLYGSTEVEPMAHIEAEQMLGQSTGEEDPKFVANGVNVGKFDSGLEVKYIKIIKEPIEITNEEQWKEIEIPQGEVGEIIVSGEHVCQKYYNNEEATRETKIRDNQGRVWHRTGDLGRVDANGDLWLVGRVHNAINRQGSYQFPVRAEFVMKKSDKILKAAYLGIKDEQLGEKTVAAYCIKEEYRDRPEAIHEEVKELLAYNEIICDHIIKVDDIPMDPRHHSKVEYGILRETLKNEYQL